MTCSVGARSGGRLGGWVLLTLPAFVLGCGPPKPGASATPALPPGVRADAMELHYEVTGTSVAEIRASLRSSAAEALPRGSTGYHRWDIRWSYRYARNGAFCELRDIELNLTSTITLPRWTGREAADPALVERWDRYVADLRAHEYGHRQLAYQGAREIQREFRRLRVEDCAFISNEATKRAEAILASYRERNSAFDADPANRVTWPPPIAP